MSGDLTGLCLFIYIYKGIQKNIHSGVQHSMFNVFKNLLEKTQEFVPQVLKQVVNLSCLHLGYHYGAMVNVCMKQL